MARYDHPGVPGRPMLPARERLMLVSLRLPPPMLAWLKAQPQGVSAACRRAIARQMQEDLKHRQLADAPTTGQLETITTAG